MAARTFAPEAAVVHVVIVVATGTAAGQADLAIHGAAMAGQAVDPLVCAVQHEVRAPVVIEIPCSPVARVVALAAIAAETHLVLVVLAMASHTFMRNPFEFALADMAFAAFHVHMFADQRKAGLFETVIEPGFFP